MVAIRGYVPLLYECVLTHEVTKVKITLPKVVAGSLDELKSLHGKVLSDCGLLKAVNKGIKDGSWTVKHNRSY